MHLATFLHEGLVRPGIIEGDRLLPISDVADMVEVIAAWSGRPQTGTVSLPLSEVRLLAPIQRPGKIVAIGLNYADHIAESKLGTPESQVWFAKTANTINGPFDPIVLPTVSDQTDYEAELVAVVGRGGRHLTRESAPAAIFGYMVGNDVSVRDWQKKTPQWLLGKSFDGHAPTGPWITTADAIDDPHQLGIQTFVNGEIRQDSNTRHLVFDLWDQLVELSKVMTLEPGDLIFTGTPGGVGAATGDFLAPGDRVRVVIDQLGAIEGECVAETEG